MSRVLDSLDSALDSMKALNYTLPRVMAVVNNINSSARVLRVANSAYFGMREEVSSLHRATILLGMNTIRNLALATAVRGSFVFDDDVCLVRSEDFWRYTVGTAVLSDLIARRAEVPRHVVDEAFILGLLHTIGKALLLQAFPQEFNEVVGLALDEQVCTDVIEDRLFDTNHREIGFTMGTKWMLPPAVLDVIRYYNRPSESDSRSTWLVSIACRSIKEARVGFAGDFTSFPIDDATYQALRIGPIEVEELVHGSLQESLDKAELFIKGA
jgi:HD-like signal output (HDOD) protein